MKAQRGSVGIVILLFTVAVIVIAALIVLPRAGKHKPPALAATSPVGTLVGFTLSPKNNSPSNFTDFFSHLPKNNAAVSWYGDWLELERSSGGHSAVAGLARQYNYTPIIDVNAYKGGSSVSQMLAIRPITSALASQYTKDAEDFCKKYSPPYFGIGTEVNRIYATSHQDFDTFVGLFNQAADAVHSACPRTKVFTTLQLEYLRGLRGGLYGGVNNEAANDWALLARFNKADLLAFTTYPGIVYHSPADMPPDYYSKISSYTDKPVAFTEVGWPSVISASGWSSSVSKQADFVGNFISQTKSLKPAFSIWSFMYDQNLPDPFAGIGLLNSDGSARPGYSAWVEQ